MSLIRSRDAALSYEEYGAGRSLVLLPGLFGTVDTEWRRFLPDLARQRHIIAADLRGHGKSNNPSGRLNLPLLAEDLHVLLETLQIEKAALCGLEWGGTAGLLFGLAHPDRITALIMHGGRLSWSPTQAEAWRSSWNPDRILAEDPGRAADLLSAHSPGNGPDGWRRLLGAAGGILRSPPLLDPPGIRLRSVPFPVLVSACSGEDPAVLDDSRRAASLIPRGSFALLEGCQHRFGTVRKEPFLRTVLAFLEEAEEGAAAGGEETP
ncbi:MAG: alpha/beta fold hydrolase [Bacteroidota bacterium]